MATVKLYELFESIVEHKTQFDQIPLRVRVVEFGSKQFGRENWFRRELQFCFENNRDNIDLLTQSL